jgi:hypothetical protein
MMMTMMLTTIGVTAVTMVVAAVGGDVAGDGMPLSLKVMLMVPIQMMYCNDGVLPCCSTVLTCTRLRSLVRASTVVPL